MKTRIIVAAIIKNGNEFLLGKKAKGQPPYPDVWHTMGGGVNDFEKGQLFLKNKDYDNHYFHSELEREIKEEANISIKNIRCICPKYIKNPREAVTKNKHGENTYYVFLEYFCDFASGKEAPGDDIAEVKWFKKDDLKSIPLTPPSEEMYKELNIIY